MRQSRQSVRHPGRERLGIEDMVRLVFGRAVVESGEELFGELKFAHVGVAALLLEAVEVAEQGY